jgi:hypothetical protein
MNAIGRKARPMDSRKFWWTPKRKIASLLGIECDEVIHSILDVMYANAPYMVIQRAMHIHPTVTELIPTMFVNGADGISNIER